LHEIVKQSQRIRERTWITADGTVKDVRGVLVGQSGAYRAGMLYNVQVLVDYSLHGAKESRWITVGQPATGRRPRLQQTSVEGAALPCSVESEECRAG
jgi:hypothetical protein